MESIIGVFAFFTLFFFLLALFYGLRFALTSREGIQKAIEREYPPEGGIPRITEKDTNQRKMLWFKHALWLACGSCFSLAGLIIFCLLYIFYALGPY